MSQRPGRNGRINAGRRSKGSGQTPVENNARSRGKKPMFPAFAPSQCDLTDRYKPQGNSSDLYENNQLYVSNLPPETNMEEVSRVFPDCVSIRLGVNNSNEQLAAYLEFPDPITTERASNQARGACIRGQYLIVSPKLKCN